MPSWSVPELSTDFTRELDRPAEAYGPDLLAGASGLVVGPHGDWCIATGIAAVRQSIEREAVANPGELASVPAWGMGLRAAVLDRRTRANAEALKARVAERLRANPRVTRTRSVAITSVANGIDVSIAADVGGRDEQVAFTVTGGSTP